jgi:phosphoadenosine phosphosulfate reductase
MLQDKIIRTFEIIKSCYNPVMPFHLAFSGGKDSIVLADLVKKFEFKHKLYFYQNPLLSRDTIDFVNSYNPVKLKPIYNFYQLVHKKGILPTRLTRYCCLYFKEAHCSNSVILTGIRKEESTNRQNRKERELIKAHKSKEYKALCNPLLDWTEQDIYLYINQNKLELPESYKYLKRNGCVGCPMSSKRTYEIFVLYPRFKFVYKKAAEIAFKAFKNSKFLNADDLLKWYLTDLSVDNYIKLRNQLSIDTLIEIETIF